MIPILFILAALIMGLLLKGLAYTGYTSPSHGVIVAGKPPLSPEYKVETATNMIPGRLVIQGTNEDDIVVGTKEGIPIGWLGYEETSSQWKPTDRDTAYAAGDWPKVHCGAGFAILSKLFAGFTAVKGDKLINWDTGMVAVGEAGGGFVCLKIPFSKQATEYDTGIELPTDALVVDAWVDVVTAVATSTIDVGLLSTEASGDADGFIDGASCASAVKVRPGATVTDGTNTHYYSANTRGVLLSDYEAGTDADTDEGLYMEKPHRIDGTTVTLSYTTSNHTIAGFIYILMKTNGPKTVGEAMAAADASAGTAVAIQVKSDI